MDLKDPKVQEAITSLRNHLRDSIIEHGNQSTDPVIRNASADAARRVDMMSDEEIAAAIEEGSKTGRMFIQIAEIPLPGEDATPSLPSMMLH